MSKTTAPKPQDYSHSWQREASVSEFIPYRTQINPYTVTTKSGDYLQVVKLDGIFHEAADTDDIDTWKDRLNTLLRSIASPQLCLWTNTVRRASGTYPGGDFASGFDADMNTHYRAHVMRGDMMTNTLYLTVLYRPHATKATGWFSKLEKDKEAISGQRADALRALDETMSIVLSGLERYRPRLLGVYDKNGVQHSEILEFFDYIINGNAVARTLPRCAISECLARARPFFGKESFELRDVTKSSYGACLGIIEYPESTEAGMLDALLSAPFPFVLTQSYAFLTKPAAISMITQQRNRMETTEDLAVSQIEALDVCLDDLASARMVYGQHHLVLTVYADESGTLRDNLSCARTILAESSMVVTREDWGMTAAFWSQLPGNAAYRPRPAPISSRNFASFSGFHNYPTGQRTGNQWGDAVTMFRTASGSPYYFNFHESSGKKHTHTDNEDDRNNANASQHKALGNTMIIGPSGSGKTVLQGFLMSQSKKFGVRQFIFDKDRGLEIYVNAGGGTYLALQNGIPTGFNPFLLDPTPENIMFLCKLTAKLCGGAVDTSEERDIYNAVTGVLGMHQHSRRLARLLDFLPVGSDNGVRERLMKWCNTGALAWVLDNNTDRIDFAHGDMFGFDVTDFLENDDVRTPVVMYLFHRIESAMNGGRVQIFMDEFWKLLLDKSFEDFAQNKQKVIRKQNGIMIYGTQSARDVLSSPIAHSLVEQCATFILMPNPKARKEDYIDGLHLTEREFDLIKDQLAPESRRFLIKQGHSAVIAELNLNGFDDEIAVISGTVDNVGLVHTITRDIGHDPKDWLPVFHKERRLLG